MTGPQGEIEVQRPIQILLAEDDPNDQTLFCTAANKTHLDLRIHLVGHGQEVVDYLEGAGAYADRQAYPLPDVLVLDLRMPVMDGFEVLAWCQASACFRALPVVALSGSVDESWADRALAAGASRFFLKAFGLANWTAMVREVVGLARGHGARSRPVREPELAGTVR
jgi:CheY-like chemotaxis protein